MKILEEVIRQNLMRLQVETLDDLWYLSQIITIGDIIKGKSTRKIKIGEKESAVKKSVIVPIKAEKVVFQGTSLRLLGTVSEGTEEIPEKAHHALTVEIGSIITIIKEEWSVYQKERLQQAKQKEASILFVVFDREEALFGLLRQRKYEILSKCSGKVASKRATGVEQENFYHTVIKMLQQQNARLQPQHIVVASPAFWKDELMKELKDDVLKKKIVLAGCSSVSKNAFQELLHRQETQAIIAKAQLAQENMIVTKLLEYIAKDGLATYGYQQVAKCVEQGAVALLLVSTGLIKEKREEDSFTSLENMMKQTERMAGKVAIINAENEAGQQIDGLGGIGAILRYNLPESD